MGVLMYQMWVNPRSGNPTISLVWEEEDFGGRLSYFEAGDNPLRMNWNASLMFS